MPTMAVSFTNLGAYHDARLCGLARVARGRVVAIETAGVEHKYPWEVARTSAVYERITLFPDRALETIPNPAARRAMTHCLNQLQPDVVAVAGYVRPECLAALRWARRHDRPCVLMSESQAIDRPRVWWKEQVKRLRVGRFDSALVGGPRHRDYLLDLGMDPLRIALGYNAIDHEFFASASKQARQSQPHAPVFLTVCRFVPEKGLDLLLDAYARYRNADCGGNRAWDLVLCGGGPLEASLRAQAESLGVAASVQWPGFLGPDELVRWYARAGAFVLASRSEPWGLVVNEAASCGVPLIVSTAAGCVPTFLPDDGETGYRFDSSSTESLAKALIEVASLSPERRARLGRNAQALAVQWGPERFGLGLLEAIQMAQRGPRRNGPRARSASR